MIGPDEGRALLIDLDGTLADSLGLLKEVFERFLAGFGCDATAAEFDQLNGFTTAEVVGALQRAHRLPGSQEDLLREYLALVAAGYRDIQPNPGAVAVLEAAQSRGWTTAVVTANVSALAKRWLDGAGVLALVDAVVGGEMVDRGKPHPDPYLAGLAAVGARSSKSLAVEDSCAGVASAVAAGIRTLLFRPVSSDGTGFVTPGIEVIGRLDDVVQYLD